MWGSRSLPSLCPWHFFSPHRFQGIVLLFRGGPGDLSHVHLILCPHQPGSLGTMGQAGGNHVPCRCSQDAGNHCVLRPAQRHEWQHGECQRITPGTSLGTAGILLEMPWEWGGCRHPWGGGSG